MVLLIRGKQMVCKYKALEAFTHLDRLEHSIQPEEFMITDSQNQQTIALSDIGMKSPLRKQLAAVWKEGNFTKSAIAFLTKGGMDFFKNKCLRSQLVLLEVA
ncbi:hypothetical protein [Novipirellula artificiosorum]|uniref:Uncharacterized protein n=1 Tax=Novipirellula artificiosorum TaxID=2528016 RepID=A0A5C6DAM0_9BACT|nr:hypothetical protein [Novipirellula artificiosorum]TWU32841.1 hypothetical protein Poly41_52180 [Novipirellula artificiosorum]